MIGRTSGHTGRLGLGSRWATIAVIALGLSASTRAHAQDAAVEPDAREFYVQGDRAYREGRYDQAVTAFQRAYELSGRPALLYNMANAYERLNRLDEAVDALENYLPTAPVDDRPAVQSRIAQLRARIAERTTQTTTQTTTSETSGPMTPPVTPSRQADLTGPGVLIGVGGALLLGSVVTGIVAMLEGNNARDMCMSVDSRTICPEAARGSFDSAGTLAITTDVLWATGAVAAAAGITWLIVELTSSGGQSSESAPTATLSIGPDHAMVLAGGSF